MSSTSSTTDPSPDASAPLPETVEVARVRRPHGVRGEVLVDVESDVPDRFAPGRRLLVRRSGEPPREVEVARFRERPGGSLLALAGCEDRDAAEALRGAVLEVPVSAVPPAPEGTWYTFELVGCRCRDAAGADLGTVVAVAEDGGGWLLEVSGSEGTFPVPFVEAIVRRVDTAGREIELDLPPGLIEACASGS